ncbi:MAG: hypothetical protein RMJ67_05145 [Elusimicrobiota bacterium]|nr:hypothetical protein [Endomicrobiia bacterium]MCX7910432.1 hypothetical protein [Endomicrobiia bacterium]MDW8165875.1 hypothetical protein [Elusimicrobiota bacterium]
MKYKKNYSKGYKLIFYFLILGMFIFYLRTQYLIILLQNKIKETYDKILILESENKKLSIELQKLLSEERLKQLSKQLNLVPITQKDIIIIE